MLEVAALRDLEKEQEFLLVQVQEVRLAQWVKEIMGERAIPMAMLEEAEEEQVK
jgi:hypothetical protein